MKTIAEVIILSGGEVEPFGAGLDSPICAGDSRVDEADRLAVAIQPMKFTCATEPPIKGVWEFKDGSRLTRDVRYLYWIPAQ